MATSESPRVGSHVDCRAGPRVDCRAGPHADRQVIRKRTECSYE